MFSPDGGRIVTAGVDGPARVWDLDGNTWPPSTATPNRGSAVFSPDGARIVTASLDGTARVWDLDGTPGPPSNGHTGLVGSAVFSPDGTRIVTASVDGTARVWGLDGPSLATLEGDSDAVSSAVFSPDGTAVATASFRRIARVLARLAGERDARSTHSPPRRPPVHKGGVRPVQDRSMPHSDMSLSSPFKAAMRHITGWKLILFLCGGLAVAAGSRAADAQGAIDIVEPADGAVVQPGDIVPVAGAAVTAPSQVE